MQHLRFNDTFSNGWKMSMTAYPQPGGDTKLLLGNKPGEMHRRRKLQKVTDGLSDEDAFDTLVRSALSSTMWLPDVDSEDSNVTSPNFNLQQGYDIIFCVSGDFQLGIHQVATCKTNLIHGPHS